MKLVLFLVFLSPMNIIGYAVQSSLLSIFVVRQLMQKRQEIDFTQTCVAAFWLFACLLGSLVGTLGGFDISPSSYLLFLYVFFVLMLFPFNINDESVINVLRVIVYLIFLSQIILSLRIDPMSEILMSIYYREDQIFNEYLASAGLSQLSWVRFGGIYINPNLCAKAYTLLLGLFIAVNHQKRHSVATIGLVSLMGLLLTGSRTGLGVGILILIVGSGVNVFRIFVYSISLIVALVFAFFWSLRFVDMESLSKSFSEKYSVVMAYINYMYDTSFSSLLFGTGDVSRIEYDFGMRLNSFDSELGYLLQGFGLLAFPILVMFIWSGFRVVKPGGRAFMVNLLWLTSSTLLMNIRFGFIYFTCLSIIYIKQSGLPILERDKCLRLK